MEENIREIQENGPLEEVQEEKVKVKGANKGLIFVSVAAIILAIAAIAALVLNVFGRGDEGYNLFNEGLLVFKSGDEYGYIDKKGKKVIKAKFDDAYDFSEGLALVEVDGEYGYINKKGEWAVKPKFDDAYYFSEGLAPVEDDDEFGYINKEGEWVVKPKFDYASPFSEGLALVEDDGEYGYINKKGEWVIKPKFGRATDFCSDGYAIVATKDKEYAVINKKGNILLTSEDPLGGMSELCSEEDCFNYVYGSDEKCYEHEDEYEYLPYCLYYDCYNRVPYSWRDYCDTHSYLEY